MTGVRSPTARLLALGLAEAAALAAMGWLPAGRETPFPALLLWAAAFLAYGAAARTVASAAPPRAAIWGGGIGARLLLLPLEPHFSEDLYRYLWDGRVQVAGLNPYAHAPADPELAGLRTTWHALVNHPEVPTIYPPAAQVVFLILAALGASAVAVKLAWLACDLATARIVDRLARGGRDTKPDASAAALLLYLWCPLPIVEVAWSGHLEPLGLLPMMAALLLLAPDGEGTRGRRAAAAGALLGIGGGVKLAPLAGLPALARRRRAAAAAGLGAFLLLALPYLGAGADLVRGLGLYAARWEFNPGLWGLLASAAGDGPARIAAGLAVAGVALAAAARGWPVKRALYWTIGAGLLLSPTLHPWYVLWILPLAALRRSVPWLLFSGLVFLAYWGRTAYLETGLWPHPAWLALLIHGPLLLGLAVEATRRWPPRSPRRTAP